MSRSLYENHCGSPTLTLLNVLRVLGVLNVLNVLYELNVLNVLHLLHGRIVGLLGLVFRCVLASLYEGLSIGPSIGPSVGRSIDCTYIGPPGTRFFRMRENATFEIARGRG